MTVPRHLSSFGAEGFGAGRFPPELPARAGIGFKPQHFDELIAQAHRIGFIEVHAENYMGDGGLPLARLSALRERFPLSLHGVGLSIGGEAPLNEEHLARLARLVERFAPQSFSEHLAWSTHDDAYLNDLLPVAYDAPTLARVVEHVDRVQSRLKRQMLLENPSTYVAFRQSSYDEIDFIREVARRSGCGLLLDVNNVMVSATNHGRNPFQYIKDFPVELVKEIHLGGYAEAQDSLGARLLIDAHDSAVAEDVWPLYRATLARTGPVATLIEWDNDVPDFAVLATEAARAEAEMRAIASGAAA
ncbi:MAG: DUF692 domain-containing protein [Proteobacteria bacterium]|nr:DUF692 domain-containing protein [Pseudomonadota bacterium]